MNNKLMWGVVAVVIAAAGLYYWSVQPAPAAPVQTGTVSQNNLGGSDTGSYDPMMVGTWKSDQDAKFTRTFNANGTIVDAYQGDASASDIGTYSVVDPLAEPAGAFGAVAPSSLTGMTVIKATFQKSGVMYFTVNSLTESSLTMTYIGGAGGILAFTKVQ